MAVCPCPQPQRPTSARATGGCRYPTPLIIRNKTIPQNDSYLPMKNPHVAVETLYSLVGVLESLDHKPVYIVLPVSPPLIRSPPPESFKADLQPANSALLLVSFLKMSLCFFYLKRLWLSPDGVSYCCPLKWWRCWFVLSSSLT